MYQRNLSLLGSQTTSQSLGESDHLELIACNKWDYDTSQFQNTIIEKWDLVCTNKIMSKIASFVFFAGTGVGVFFAGILADKIGRHRTICLFILLFIAAGFASAFAPSIELWMVARFFWGAASLGLRSVKMVSALELVGSTWRAIICVGFVEGGWTFGYLSLLLISESPKWLLAIGKREQCRAVMSRIMTINGISKEVVIQENKDEIVGGNFFDLFRTSKIRRTTFVI